MSEYYCYDCGAESTASVIEHFSCPSCMGANYGCKAIDPNLIEFMNPIYMYDNQYWWEGCIESGDSMQLFFVRVPTNVFIMPRGVYTKQGNIVDFFTGEELI
jgi:hypothetical protein